MNDSDPTGLGFYAREETGYLALLLGVGAAPYDDKVIVSADRAALETLGDAWVREKGKGLGYRLAEVEELPTECGAVEVVILYAPDQGEVLIVDGEIVDTSDGPAHGDYLDVPQGFFAGLGRALGIRFAVHLVEVDPCALDGEYWSWIGVAETWLAARGADRGGSTPGTRPKSLKSN